MGIEKQGNRPTGWVGKIFGKLMNRFHTPLYVSYWQNKLPVDNSKILDTGCGGGRFLRFLSEANNSYMLYGIDHSPEMVKLAFKTNIDAVKQGRIKIFQGDVNKLPFDDLSMDMVTAFETVQFWPETEAAFSEISRVLKQNGRFVIINRYPKPGSKWWKLAHIKSDGKYKNLLNKAGFHKVITNLSFKKGWIFVEAFKF